MASTQAERINQQLRHAQAEANRVRVTSPPVSPAAASINAQIKAPTPPPVPPAAPAAAPSDPTGLQRAGNMLRMGGRIAGGAAGTALAVGATGVDAYNEIQQGVTPTDAASRALYRTGGTILGATAGRAAGAALGGAVGTGGGGPVGTVVGGVAGMAAGGYAGNRLGDYAADRFVPIDYANQPQAQGQARQMPMMDGSGNATDLAEQRRLLANSRAGQVQVIDSSGSDDDRRAQANLRQQLGPALPANTADTNYNYGVTTNEARLRATTPRGAQGAHITNGDTVENRLAKIASSASFRGSPSMRRAAAEAVMQEDQQQWKTGEAVLDRNSMADIEASRLQTGLDNNRAERGLRRETFNSELGETRRKNDMDGRAAMVEANAKAIESQSKTQAEQLKALNDRANALMDQRLRAGDTVEQAAAFAGDALHAMGFDPEQVDVARGSNFYRGQTVADAGVRRETTTGLRSVLRNARNGLEEQILGVNANPTRGVGAENFNPAGGPNIAQRAGLALIPGGYSAAGDNAPVIWNDAASGGTFATPRSALRAAGIENAQRWRDRYNPGNSQN